MDNYNLRGSYLIKAKINNKEIHTRSAFLQGLFFMEEGSIPPKLSPLKRYINDIRVYCENESIDLPSLALSYAYYNLNIDHVLIGVDNREQLSRNLNSLMDLKNAFNYINRKIHVKETEDGE